MAHDDEPKDHSAGLIGIGIPVVMAVCCLGIPLLLSIGAAGVASLFVDSLWWLGPAAVVLALVIVGARLVGRAGWGRARRITPGGRPDD